MGAPYPFNETLPTPPNHPPNHPPLPHPPTPQTKGGYCPPMISPHDPYAYASISIFMAKAF